MNIPNSLNVVPYSGRCYNYANEDSQSSKTIWLVPHVIKYREDSLMITWRCNWGNTCTSKCLYAMKRKENQDNVNSGIELAEAFT
jgi:hypothetical protein